MPLRRAAPRLAPIRATWGIPRDASWALDDLERLVNISGTRQFTAG
jgi:hypothetical protein